MRSLAAAIQRSISLVPSAAVVVAGVVLVVDVEKLAAGAPMPLPWYCWCSPRSRLPSPGAVFAGSPDWPPQELIVA